MAPAPGDRFPAMGEMVLALEGYLEESGIASDKIASELGRYFQGPAAYEQALRDRMIDHLTRCGQRKLAEDDRTAALDVFDRVLTIDPQNAKVLELLDGINRRKRRRSQAIALGLAAVVALGAWGVQRATRPPPSEPPESDAAVASASSDAPPAPVRSAPLDAAVVAAVGVPTQIRVSPAKDAE